MRFSREFVLKTCCFDHLIHDKPLLMLLRPDLPKLQNIAISQDDAFPEIDFGKGLGIL